jgi:hypothetical protein
LELDVHVLRVNIDSVENHECVDGLDLVVLDISWNALSDILGGLRDTSENALVLSVDQSVIGKFEGTLDVDRDEVNDVVLVVNLVSDNQVVADVVSSSNSEDEVVKLPFVGNKLGNVEVGVHFFDSLGSAETHLDLEALQETVILVHWNSKDSRVVGHGSVGLETFSLNVFLEGSSFNGLEGVDNSLSGFGQRLDSTGSTRDPAKKLKPFKKILTPSIHQGSCSSENLFCARQI